MFPTDPNDLAHDRPDDQTIELQEAEHDMVILTRTRAIASREQKKQEAIVKSANAGLATFLERYSMKRHQLPNAAVVQMVEPEPRTRVSPEKLLELGVSASIIEQATITSPVQPYIRVDGGRFDLPDETSDKPTADAPSVEHPGAIN